MYLQQDKTWLVHITSVVKWKRSQSTHYPSKEYWTEIEPSNKFTLIKEVIKNYYEFHQIANEYLYLLIQQTSYLILSI